MLRREHGSISTLIKQIETLKECIWLDYAFVEILRYEFEKWRKSVIEYVRSKDPSWRSEDKAGSERIELPPSSGADPLTSTATGSTSSVGKPS